MATVRITELDTHGKPPVPDAVSQGLKFRFDELTAARLFI
jgi:hypothetical protein